VRHEIGGFTMNLRRAMSVSERLWFWVQPLLAALALVAGATSWFLQFTGNLNALPTVQSLITGQFVLPGLALSLLINQVAVGLRRPPMLTVGEKLLLIVQLAVVAAILAISPSSELLFLGFLLWPLLIAVATIAFATMASTTIRLRRPLATDETGGMLSEPTVQSR
jgi:fumarate reductase subunit C